MLFKFILKLQQPLLTILPFLMFLGLFALQYRWPKRLSVKHRHQRQLNNLLLFVFNTLALSLTPVTLAIVSAWAHDHQLGLFNQIAIPTWLPILVCIIAMDLAVYWQHVATHKFDILWRLHRVHHSDLEMDVTTAVRFHPIELLLSLTYKSTMVIILGMPVAAIIIFELLLLLGAEFSHSNWAIPKRFDRLLRTMIITPDVHRVHHSVFKDEQDTNYGFFLIWWDKLFGTYTKQPKQGHDVMQIGLLKISQQKHCEAIHSLLTMPFKQ